MTFLIRFWNSIKPSYHARRGAVLAALVAVVWTAVVGALALESGFGLWADALFAALVAVVGIGLVTLVVALVLSVLRPLPRILTGFFVGATAFVSLLWMNVPFDLFGLSFVFVECVLGATLATIIRGGLHNATTAKRVVTWGLLLLAVAGNVGIFALLHSDGVDEKLLQIRQTAGTPIAADDPSRPGPYAVKTLYYGSGDSLRRPEFGNGVAIKTKPVNASLFFKDFKGWKAWIRKLYWGFGMDKLPLNGTVYYPDGAGPFPLFLIVHGNHQMSVASDRGYEYLGRLLASRGMITVSVDENFLNSGLFHDPPKQQAVRGWVLLEHLRVWHEWMKDAKNPLYGKTDLSNIAVGGHSRGGEAAATAALFNKLAYDPDDANIRFHYGYGIKSVVAIAPPDGQYKPAEQPRVLSDVNYFVFQGANDSDVSSFGGSKQYDRVHFSGKVSAFKSELYIYRANHGQFNTMWGRTDIGMPENWLLDLSPLLEAEKQRQISKVYISAFLEATLKGRNEYEGLFRDFHRGLNWLPQTLYVNRFQDQSYKAICSFDEDADLTTTTLAGGHIMASGLKTWREGKIPFRDGSREYNGVFVGWDAAKSKTPAVYEISLPAAMEMPALALSVAATDEDMKDKDATTEFTVEVTSANGASGRVVASVLPPLHVRFTKLQKLDEEWYKKASEPVFQSILLPASAFKGGFDGRALVKVRLIFDKTPARTVIVGGIGVAGS